MPDSSIALRRSDSASAARTSLTVLVSSSIRIEQSRSLGANGSIEYRRSCMRFVAAVAAERRASSSRIVHARVKATPTEPAKTSDHSTDEVTANAGAQAIAATYHAAPSRGPGIRSRKVRDAIAKSDAKYDSEVGNSSLTCSGNGSLKGQFFLPHCYLFRLQRTELLSRRHGTQLPRIPFNRE